MQSVRLILTDLVTNHNKYWIGSQEGSVVRVEWGRVGDRAQTKSFSCYSEEAAIRDLEKRKNEKIKKGYSEQYTIPTNGSAPISNVAVIAKTQIEHNNNKETEALIDFLVSRNIHAIVGATNIRLENGLLTTPLGPVTTEGLNLADNLLVKMSKTKEIGNLVNQYLRIVPRNIGHKRIDPQDIFGTKKQLEDEKTLLDSLRAVVTDAEQKAAVNTPIIFQTRLSLVNKSNSDFKRIEQQFYSNINNMHTSSKLKLVRLWQMHIQSMNDKFEWNIGNIKELWHGTQDANLLSILKGGYVIANRSSGIKITGRMYGDGIYFSDQSSKSLNYSTSYWGGSGSQRHFMIWNNVAMGREYIPNGGFSAFKGLPGGYDSTYARAGQSGVRNNEFVVYRTSQINPIFLAEFQ